MDKIQQQAQQIRARAAMANMPTLNADMVILRKLTAEAQRKRSPKPVHLELSAAMRAVAAYQVAEKVKGKSGYVAARKRAEKATRAKSSGCASTAIIGLVALVAGVRSVRKH